MEIHRMQDLSVINVKSVYETYSMTLSTRGTISSGGTLMNEEAHKAFNMNNIYIFKFTKLI